MQRDSFRQLVEQLETCQNPKEAFSIKTKLYALWDRRPPSVEDQSRNEECTIAELLTEELAFVKQIGLAGPYWMDHGRAVSMLDGYPKARRLCVWHHGQTIQEWIKQEDGSIIAHITPPKK